MTEQEIQDYVSQRRGKYGIIYNDGEELFTIKPEAPSYRYDENYVLEIKEGKK